MKEKARNPQKAKGSESTSWGFRALDKYTKGLQPGQLALFTAYPGIGKTAFALNVAERLALEQNIPIGMVSLEMTYQQLRVRLACSYAKIDLLQLYLGKGSEKAEDKFSSHLSTISKAPFHIFATPRITLGELEVEARRLQNRFRIQLLMIDSLNLISMNPPTLVQPSSKKMKDLASELVEIVVGIKSLAKDLKLPVLLLNQIPVFKAIEKQADIVCLLAPNDAYEEQKGKAMETITAEVAITKNRNGSTGKVKLKFLPKYTRFEDF